MQAVTPSTSPSKPVEEPAYVILPPPIVSPVAEAEMSSSPSNQLIPFEAWIESPVLEPGVTDDQLRTAINSLYSLLMKSNMSSKDTSKVVSALRQTMLQEIHTLHKSLDSQCSEFKSFSAKGVADFSGQLARTEQRLDAKIETLSTQLANIIFYLSGADDNKREEARRRATTIDEEPGKRFAAEEEMFRRQMDEERQMQQTNKRGGVSGSRSSWFRR